MENTANNLQKQFNEVEIHQAAKIIDEKFNNFINFGGAMVHSSLIENTKVNEKNKLINNDLINNNLINKINLNSYNNVKPIKCVKLTKTAKLPTRKTLGSAGYDIHADCYVKIGPGETKKISTGVVVEIPINFVGLVKSRSSLFAHNLIYAFDGTIDCDYTGELFILLTNHSDIDFTVGYGDRIAQLLITPCYCSSVEEVKSINDFDIIKKKNQMMKNEISFREIGNSGGFGSTGK